ncbi:transcriptional regulator [Candidatus Zixiibacteriota bacterium]
MKKSHTDSSGPERDRGDLHPLAEIDRVIHGPARLMVMTSLYVLESADFVFLIRLTGLTWGNLSSHLTTLEEAGYVELEKKIVGKRMNTMVMLTGEGRKAFRAWKKQMQDVLDDLPA